MYTLEKWTPLRYTIRDRMVAYRRAFNYGTAPGPAGAIVNSNFHRQFVGFMVSLSQYFRDLLIGEVIRGGLLIEQVEAVSNRYLNGIAEPSQRAKMAESGRRILQFVADNDFKTAVDPILFQSEVRPMGAHAEATSCGVPRSRIP